MNPSVFIISRDEALRTRTSAYCAEKGYAVQEAHNYDAAMETLPSIATNTDALIIDIQGVPRGEHGTAFPQFSQWLERFYREKPPTIVYLLRKGSRRPNIRLDGIILKKPFPLEALGEVLRQKLRFPVDDRANPRFNLDLASNCVRGPGGEAHLTRIEATLLAFLMEHEGQTQDPADLLLQVWQYENPEGANTLVRAHISNLRKKLREATGTDDVIQTVRGKGYRFIAA